MSDILTAVAPTWEFILIFFFLNNYLTWLKALTIKGGMAVTSNESSIDLYFRKIDKKTFMIGETLGVVSLKIQWYFKYLNII
jgi:hypothetical protein